MSKLFVPIHQRAHVAVVRMKKGGKLFEIACYKNKVMSWRNNEEKHLNQVLHSRTVFVNLSKGQVANKDDLVSVFGKEDQTAICIEILEKGELQGSGRERQSQLDEQVKDVANTIAGLCINPDTKRPYPTSIIEKGLKDVHFSVKPNRNAKQQALEVIPQLKEVMKIERAQMREVVDLPVEESMQNVGPSDPAPLNLTATEQIALAFRNIAEQNERLGRIRMEYAIIKEAEKVLEAGKRDAERALKAAKKDMKIFMERESRKAQQGE